MTDYAALMNLVIVYTVVIAVLLLFLIAGYIFRGIAFYKMAKRKGITHAWLAWIPVANEFLFGELIDDKVVFLGFEFPFAKYFLLIVPIVITALTLLVKNSTAFSLIMTVIIILFMIYQFAAYYRLFKFYSPKQAVLFTVLSAVFFWVPLLTDIFCFAIRNKELHPESDHYASHDESINYN